MGPGHAEISVKRTIEAKLTEALQPERLEIEDESHLHEGHAGARPGGESHFRVTVVSAAFAELSRVERQRLVYRVLADELAGPVHALAVSALTPDQDRR